MITIAEALLCYTGVFLMDGDSPDADAFPEVSLTHANMLHELCSLAL